MAKKRFKVDILSQSSIEQLKKDLQAYQNDLQRKTRLFVKRLAEKGVIVANAKIGESPLGKYVSMRTEISEKIAGTKAIIIATGAVKQSEGYEDFNTLLAIEFGAGIHFNPTPNPNADKFGLGVGTFPGQMHAFQDIWFYWDETEQMWKPTHGVKATMPMYTASMEIIQEIVKTAKEVFE